MAAFHAVQRIRRTVSPARLGAALVASLALHAVVMGAVLGVRVGDGPDRPPASHIVLVDLSPMPEATATSLALVAAERPTETAAPDALALRVADLSAENAALSARLGAAEQRADELTARRDAERARTAQLEAEHRQEIAALESAASRLGERLAALAADREALAADLAAEREQRAALADVLAAEREAAQAAMAEERATYDRLVSALRQEIADRDVALERAQGRLTVAIVDRVLFPSGQAALSLEGARVIDSVGAALARAQDRGVLVEGHTDDVPIGPELSARFPSNWELSAARATGVVKRLIEVSNLPPARLRAVGRADTEPVASNDTEDGRRRNRRIEIILLPPGALDAS